MIFNATVSSASSNSYCSLAFADGYHANRLHNADWFEDFVKEKLAAALITATGYIDLFRYKGRPTVPGQALKFPRAGMYYNGGYAVSDEIPVQVKNACAQIALDYLRSDFAGRSSQAQAAVQGSISSIKAGSFQIAYGGDGATVSQTSPVGFLSNEARLLLNPFFGVNYSGGAPIVRV